MATFLTQTVRTGQSLFSRTTKVVPTFRILLFNLQSAICLLLSAIRNLKSGLVSQIQPDQHALGVGEIADDLADWQR